MQNNPRVENLEQRIYWLKNDIGFHKNIITRTDRQKKDILSLIGNGLFKSSQLGDLNSELLKLIQNRPLPYPTFTLEDYKKIKSITAQIDNLNDKHNLYNAVAKTIVVLSILIPVIICVANPSLLTSYEAYVTGGAFLLFGVGIVCYAGKFKSQTSEKTQEISEILNTYFKDKNEYHQGQIDILNKILESCKNPQDQKTDYDTEEYQLIMNNELYSENNSRQEIDYDNLEIVVENRNPQNAFLNRGNVVNQQFPQNVGLQQRLQGQVGDENIQGIVIHEPQIQQIPDNRNRQRQQNQERQNRQNRHETI